jgi:hypothetical protein
VTERARQLPGDAVAGVRSLVEDARSVAAAFRTGTVTLSFRSHAATLGSEARLQLVTLRQLEVFERTDEVAVFWGRLRLPDVVVEARAPVEYVYSVSLEAPWDFRLADRELRVTAPALEAGTPALDVSALAFEVRKGSILRDEEAAREALRRGLTALARLRADAALPLVREPARRKAEEFVESWLRERFSDGGTFRARVRFADEGELDPR